MVFPGEIYRAQELDGAQRSQAHYFHEVDKGGQFAAWEQPELFASKVQAKESGRLT
jgi:hypothetical protein